MAEATEQYIRDGQGTRLDSLSSAQITQWLAVAKKIVIRAGVPLDHERFAELQAYKVWDFLESTGSIPNEVGQEAVGDVSVSYDTNIAIGSAVFWKDRYNEELANVLGADFRFC